MPKCLPADDDFLRTAPQRLVGTFRIPRPAAEVWAELAGDVPLAWCRGLRARWTSPRPFGVGTTREVTVPGRPFVAQEHFFAWEEGRRHAFYVDRLNVPVFRRLAEDYVVEPEGPERCVFTWTAAIEPTRLGRLGTPLNPLAFGSLHRDTRRHFGAEQVR